MFSYEDYLKWIENRNAAPRMNDGQGYSAMSRPVFDEAAQSGNLWNLMGNLVDLQPGDPGYDAAQQAILAQQPGSDTRSIAYSSQRGGADPNKTVAMPDGYAWSVDNSVHPKESDDWKLALMGIGTVLGGGFLGNLAGFGGAELGGLEGGAFDMGGSAGFGGSTPLGEAGAGAFDMGGSAGFGGSTPLASGPADSYWSQLASNGSTDGLYGGGELSGGDLPYGTEMPNVYEAGANPLSASPAGHGLSNSWLTRLLGPLANPAGLPQWIGENPMSALRAGAGIASIIAAARGNGGGSSGGGGAGGSIPWNGPLPQLNIQQGQFQQNPHLNFNVPFMRGY